MNTNSPEIGTDNQTSNPEPTEVRNRILDLIDGFTSFGVITSPSFREVIATAAQFENAVARLEPLRITDARTRLENAVQSVPYPASQTINAVLVDPIRVFGVDGYEAGVHAGERQHAGRVGVVDDLSEGITRSLERRFRNRHRISR